ncbi:MULTISPECIES: hypothetical protein [unclassified Streptomyces]|uniref:hypothetical protein n=1 Tax=unclassified Streptomyces TaxID=2593676 RepID=UPI00225A5F49|nr:MULTISPECIES: hypothetical protein [unclassified Streptomyces]MCX5337491.1 hypothetical protein [Streptomyces sp. NBC_00140]MCX5365558.1 hypothetical protein [Streptomyces sp. NBC_00124]
MSQRARSPLTARLLLAGGLTLLTLVTGCGAGSDESKVSSSTEVTAAPSAGVVAPAKVEVIAGLVGCKVKIRTDADELREGVCHGKDGDFLITTFPEERFKLTWLDAASIYGGKYLVGTRWVVSAPEALLKKFRPELGGNIQQL